MGCVECFLPYRIYHSVSFARVLDGRNSDRTSSNLVYIAIFFTIEMTFLLTAASYFTAADGNQTAALGIQKAAGAFGFASGMLGYYTVGNLMCQDALNFDFPMGDTGRFFKRKRS